MMKTENWKIVGRWCIALSVITLLVFAYRSCESHKAQKREERKREEMDKVFTDPYVYKDVNGVYHISHDCYMLNDTYWNSEDEKVRGNYSSQYISRDSIRDWKAFAATHQLCSECFSPELIRQLDSVYMDRNRDMDEEYYNRMPGRDRATDPRAPR